MIRLGLFGPEFSVDVSSRCLLWYGRRAESVPSAQCRLFIHSTGRRPNDSKHYVRCRFRNALREVASAFRD